MEILVNALGKTKLLGVQIPSLTEQVTGCRPVVLCREQGVLFSNETLRPRS